jgi:hypothetical protein
MENEMQLDGGSSLMLVLDHTDQRTQRCCLQSELRSLKSIKILRALLKSFVNFCFYLSSTDKTNYQKSKAEVRASVTCELLAMHVVPATS